MVSVDLPRLVARLQLLAGDEAVHQHIRDAVERDDDDDARDDRIEEARRQQRQSAAATSCRSVNVS